MDAIIFHMEREAVTGENVILFGGMCMFGVKLLPHFKRLSHHALKKFIFCTSSLRMFDMWKRGMGYLKTFVIYLFRTFATPIYCQHIWLLIYCISKNLNIIESIAQQGIYQHLHTRNFLCSAIDSCNAPGLLDKGVESKFVLRVCIQVDRGRDYGVVGVTGRWSSAAK